MKYLSSISIILFVVILLASLPSCSSNSSINNNFPGVDIPVEEMNTIIQIEDLPEFRNTYKNNEFLGLHIKNLSDKTIVFQIDSCILIFSGSGDNWLSTINTMHYPSEIRSLPSTKVYPPGMVIETSPNIPDMVGKQIIRIIVLGHYEDSEDQLVGAYIDVTLLP
jgi:hypothetical protein